MTAGLVKFFRGDELEVALLAGEFAGDDGVDLGIELLEWGGI